MSNSCTQNIHISKWLENTKFGHINKDVLLLFYSSRIGKSEIHEKLKNTLKILEIINYKIIDIDEIDTVKDEKNDTNIILLGYILVDIIKLSNIDYHILFCFPDYDNDLLLNIDNDDFITEIPFYKYMIKTQKPISLINSLSTLKQRILALYIHKGHGLFSSLEILQSDNNMMDFDLWFTLINEDIKLFNKKRILTARLAVSIYKLATLKLNDTNTKIGIYYRKKLGIKSKTMRIKVKGESMLVKAYDLMDTIKVKELN